MQNAAKSFILFPGQGSQYVGMAKNLTDKGRSLFDMASEVLRYDLLKLCNNGPEAELNRTIHSQPAVFVTSLAAVEKLAAVCKEAISNCVATAGFSVGEYAALVFAQSLDFVDALKVLKKRAEVSQSIGEDIPSGLMTVIFGTDGRVGEACQMAKEFCIRSGMSETESVCSISNYMFPHAKIVGGHQTALDFIERNKSDFGIRKVKRLAVSAAFHTSLLKPAVPTIRSQLDNIKVNNPKVLVYSNISGTPYLNADHIRLDLPRQIYKPVKWEQTIQNLYGDFLDDNPVTFECGPQNQMTTILAMINKKARQRAYNIEVS